MLGRQQTTALQLCTAALACTALLLAASSWRGSGAAQQVELAYSMGGDPPEGIPEIIHRGGWQQWAGVSGYETFPWDGWDEREGPQERRTVHTGSSSHSYEEEVNWQHPEGPVDITDVGEGTERVRLGLEGAWGGISSPSRPGSGNDHEGGGFEEDPLTSSLPIRPDGSRYVYDESGFPGDVEEGNFPGVNPDNPDGTSWMIGQHRDGEDTMGKWAVARRRGEGVRRQQLALMDPDVTEDGVRVTDEAPNPRADDEEGGGEAGESEGEEGEGFGGQDITQVGEDNQEKHVPGVYGPLPTGTSWIVGEHRRPQWSDSQTYACGTTEPCKKGLADRQHYFQRDTNPFVDKRRVFDSYAQGIPGHPRGRDVFPWDPARDPAIFHSSRPDCADGEMRDDCFRPAKHAMKLPLGPKLPVPAAPGPPHPNGIKTGARGQASTSTVSGKGEVGVEDEPIIFDGSREITWRNDKKGGGWKQRGEWRDGIWREGRWRDADWKDWDSTWANWVDRALERHHYTHHHHHHHFHDFRPEVDAAEDSNEWVPVSKEGQ